MKSFPGKLTAFLSLFFSHLLTLSPCHLVILTSGCRHGERVESKLRGQEKNLRELRDDLSRSEDYNRSLEREVCELRQSQSNPSPAGSEAATPAVKEVVLGRQTGGSDEDRLPGDEALQVVLEPRDANGQPVKASGSLRVTAMTISPTGLKMPLSTWDVTADQLRGKWRSGLLSTGYFVTLPWQVVPVCPKLRVVAQFALTDGRIFEVERDVLLRLAPAASSVEILGHPIPLPTPGQNG